MNSRYSTTVWARDLPPMLHNKRSDDAAHRLLFILASYAKNDGTDIWASIDTLVAKTGYSAAKIRATLDRLIARGYIRAEKASNGADGWAINLDAEITHDTVVETRLERHRAAARERKRRQRQRQRGGDGHAQLERDVTPELSVTSPVPVTHQLGVTPPNVTPQTSVTSHPMSVTPAGQKPVTIPIELPKEEIPTETTSPAVAGNTNLFTDFYEVYPRKINRKAAHKAWAKALKAGHDPEVIIRAAREFAVLRAGQDPQYTPYPSTWLNGQRWEDQPAAPIPQPRAYTPWSSPTDHSVYYEDF